VLFLEANLIDHLLEFCFDPGNEGVPSSIGSQPNRGKENEPIFVRACEV
jgi:hypothetical protein